jgi:membrane protein
VVVQGVDQFQRQHPALGFPLAVLYKYFEDFGPYLAALIAYYAFVSLFPLMLVLATVLEFVLAGDPGLQQQMLHSALAQFPVVGDQLGEPKRLGGGTVGLIVGILGSLYGGLGVAQAAQYAMNTAWRVPRNSRPNPFKARSRSVVLLAVTGLAVSGTTALSTLGTTGGGSFNMAVTAAILAASVAINAAVFVFAFRFATTRRLSIRDVAPGAIAAALAWQVLQSFGIVYIAHVVKNASATNGVFALVLGMLAFLYITATVVVVCIEINVVRVDNLYPRALLTPFTDNVELTHADRRSYANQAQAQRSKGFQDVDVTFDPPSRIHAIRSRTARPPDRDDPAASNPA